MNEHRLAMDRPGGLARGLQSPGDLYFAVWRMDENGLGVEFVMDPALKLGHLHDAFDVCANVAHHVERRGGLPRNVDVVDLLSVFAALQTMVPTGRLSAVEQLFELVGLQSNPWPATKEAKRVDRQVRGERLGTGGIRTAAAEAHRRGTFAQQIIAASVSAKPFGHRDEFLGA